MGYGPWKPYPIFYYLAIYHKTTFLQTFPSRITYTPLGTSQLMTVLPDTIHSMKPEKARVLTNAGFSVFYHSILCNV